ncbi:MAG: NAD(P)H-dependent oxidoreductase [Flavobacteriaceae bacterium]|nr:NAD(P)H-dependent oxidoreductase [Flavobacteriaceae bacterium]
MSTSSTIIEKLQWRYAVKNFDADKKLSEEKMATLKESFNLTATSYGLQPLKMLVVSNPEVIKDMVPMSMNQAQVGNASHILVLCTETKIDATYIKEYFNLVEDVRNTPRKILDPFQEFLIESFSEKSEDELNVWMQKQAYLALGNLLTVCAIEDIDACPIEGFNPSEYDEYFELKEKGLASVLVLAVGYRSEEDIFSGFKKVRKGVEEVIIEVK